MTKLSEQDRDYLMDILSYNPVTGIFRRKKDVSNQHVGDIAGAINNHGYWIIYVDGKFYLGHRLAWLFVYGEWPSNEIDHINGIRHDNRPHNLRDVSRSVNQHNRHHFNSNNTSGHHGVRQRHGKWQASIRLDGEHFHLGSYTELDDALKAREYAELEYSNGR